MIKNNSGFTLVELIIVLAVLAIIGAILIPNFLNTTDRARLRSDIQSARVLQNALDLHNIEQTSAIGSSTDINAILSDLDAKGYIDRRRVAAQTSGASFRITNGKITIDITNATSENVKTTLYNQLSDQEKEFVSNGPAS